MRSLTPAHLNPAILNVQYAVRGELAIKADELNEKLRSQEHQGKLPFKKVINSNIGNPQQKGLDQPPITFTRQVCAPSTLRLPFAAREGAYIALRFFCAYVARTQHVYAIPASGVATRLLPSQQCGAGARAHPRPFSAPRSRSRPVPFHSVTTSCSARDGC